MSEGDEHPNHVPRLIEIGADGRPPENTHLQAAFDHMTADGSATPESQWRALVRAADAAAEHERGPELDKVLADIRDFLEQNPGIAAQVQEQEMASVELDSPAMDSPDQRIGR